MFLSAFERYSTVACAPASNLPSTFVLSSARNWTVFTSWSFVTRTDNSASPNRCDFPRQQLVIGRGLPGTCRRWGGRGVDQAAVVKQGTNSVIRNREVRNRIKYPQIQLDLSRS